MLITYFILIWLLAIIQISIFNFIPFGLVGINILLCSIILLLFIDKDYLAFLLAGFGGLIMDILSASFFGAWTISFLIIFLVVRLIRKPITSKNIYLVLLVVFAASILQLIFSFFFLTLFNSNLKPVEVILPTIYSAAANTIFSGILIAIYNFYKNKKGHFILRSH